MGMLLNKITLFCRFTHLFPSLSLYYTSKRPSRPDQAGDRLRRGPEAQPYAPPVPRPGQMPQNRDISRFPEPWAARAGMQRCIWSVTLRTNSDKIASLREMFMLLRVLSLLNL
ncbi:MAG: hypothetical protein ACI4O7_06630 [Aristaeellaceae bacterium]